MVVPLWGLFHRSSQSPFPLDFYKFERMDISGKTDTFVQEMDEEWSNDSLW